MQRNAGFLTILGSCERLVLTGSILGLFLVASSGRASPIYAGDALFTQGDRILAVNLLSGEQRVVAEGGLLSSPTGVTADSAGNIFAVDNDSIVHIAPDGTQQILSAGDLLVGSTDLTLDLSGNLIAPSNSPCCDLFNSTGLVLIGRDSGEQTQLIADFPINGPGGLGLSGVAQVEMTADGDILALNRNGLMGSFGGVSRIDPETGTGDFDLILSGGLWIYFSDLAVAPDGDIFVNYFNVGTDEIDLVVFDSNGVFEGVFDTTHSYTAIAFDELDRLIGLEGDSLFDIGDGETLIASGDLLDEGVLMDMAIVPRSPIPEPHSAVLFAVGGLLAGVAVERKARR